MYQKAVLLWMHDPAGRDAIIVKQSLSGDTHNLEAGSEIICSRTPSQIQTLKQIYYSMFGVYVERDIEYHTSGDQSKVIALCCLFVFNGFNFITN